jgi:hypothetical protein
MVRAKPITKGAITMRRALPLLLIAVGLFVGPEPARAGTIAVSPGAGTLQAAVNAAQPGDTLKLAPGTYTGAVTVDRRLKIVASGNKLNSWIIDGACATNVTLTIAADGVKILGKGLFVVTGATTTQMQVMNAPTFYMKQAFIRPHIPTACGTEQNGLEILGGSAKTTLVHVVPQFNPNVGMLLDGITGDVSFKATGNSFDDNGIGVRVQSSGGGSEPGKSGITLKKSFFVQVSTLPLLELIDSDGVQVAKSQMEPYDNGVGFQVDAQSDRNVFVGNKLVEKGTPYVGVTLYSDAGMGNCGKNNEFGISPCP